VCVVVRFHKKKQQKKNEGDSDKKAKNADLTCVTDALTCDGLVLLITQDFFKLICVRRKQLLRLITS